MNVASKDLCKDLYKLSGLDSSLAGAGHRWILTPNGDWECFRLSDAEVSPPEYKKAWFNGIPAYNLGYLLRKLPPEIDGWFLSIGIPVNIWISCYTLSMADSIHHSNVAYEQLADTPEDATCKLAIELFKQGILKKETP